MSYEVSRYIFDEEQDYIGGGSFGEVFEARDTRKGNLVALKRMKLGLGREDGVPATAIREIAALRHLRHPCIVMLLDVELSANKLHLIFERLDKDLKKYLESLDPAMMNPNLIKSYAYQITNAVCFCHMRRIVHRDMKPQNLLVDSNGVIKIADFGLARTFGIPVRVTTHEAVTLWYRAPEILLGMKRYGPPVDVWSIGVIIVEMVNKKALFRGDCEIDQIYKIFEKMGTPNEGVWPGVTELQDFNEQACPKWSPKGVLQLLRLKDNDLADLVTLMLTYHPGTRISAKAALHHKYFADLDRSKHPLRRLIHYPPPPNFNPTLSNPPLPTPDAQVAAVMREQSVTPMPRSLATSTKLNN